MRVGSLGMISGCSVTEFFCNKIANWFWIITYNSKELVQLHAFDHFVDDQCLCHQPKDGTKSGQSVKSEECHNYNEQVAEQQSGGMFIVEYFLMIMAMMSVPPPEAFSKKSRAAAIAGSKIAKQSSSEI